MGKLENGRSSANILGNHINTPKSVENSAEIQQQMRINLK